MIDLPIVLIRLHIQQDELLQLPQYAGSMLRGAFGHALRLVACLTEQNDCKSCPLYYHCPYTQVFETPSPLGEPHQQVANPYIISVPDAMSHRTLVQGDTWYFDFIIIGKAIDQLPLLLDAWQLACERGFGKQYAKAQLMHVSQQQQIVYMPNGSLSAKLSTLQPLTHCASNITLKFMTPLRLQYENQLILNPQQLSANILLIALAKRVQRLLDIHVNQPIQLNMSSLIDAAQQIRISSSELKPAALSRYSNRQQRAMNLNGLVGKVCLEGEWQYFAELLAIGQFVGVGKSTTFGLGQYQIV